jgi:hypothetical protein
METHEKAKAKVDELLHHYGYTFKKEYRICEERTWKADWAVMERYVEKRIAKQLPVVDTYRVGILIEYEGGGFLPGGGRHHRGTGARGDMVKYSCAALLGWTVLRVDDRIINSGILERWLRAWPAVWIPPTWWLQSDNKRKKEK